MDIKTHLSPCHTQVRSTIVKVDHEYWNLHHHEHTRNTETQDQLVAGGSQGAESEHEVRNGRIWRFAT